MLYVHIYTLCVHVYNIINSYECALSLSLYTSLYTYIYIYIYTHTYTYTYTYSCPPFELGRGGPKDTASFEMIS